MNSQRLSFMKPAKGSGPSGAFTKYMDTPIGILKLLVVITLVDVLLYHMPLYSFAIENLSGLSFNTIYTLATLSVVIFVVTVFILSPLLLISQRLLKPIGIVIFISNSIALYFIETYQAVLDRTMMGNVLNTNVSEASSFLSFKLVLYVIVLGLLPSWLLLKKRVQHTTRLRLSTFAIVTVFAGMVWIYVSASTWLWIDKNAKRLGGMIMPWSYVVNTVRQQALIMASSREQIPLPPATFAADDKRVVILVIGESARKQNFSLYGYDRPTNPLLAAAGAVALSNTVSCTTYTTASLRCMLSYNHNSSLFSDQYEPLPSYLQRIGADVIWRTRNWGEPPLKIQSYARDKELIKKCKGETDCQGDGILLTGLEERIRSSKSQKIFVILHTKGSHGPDYYKRYPSRFEKFKPVCKSVELSKCTDEELLNAYDNTILYTDYFISRAIGILKDLGNIPTMLMYMSDHGESLGEHGLYLHGTPYTIAPDAQKEIPFIVWMSPAFEDREGITAAQLAKQHGHSQANVFHSILGAFDVRSDVYDKTLDIFSSKMLSAGSS